MVKGGKIEVDSLRHRPTRSEGTRWAEPAKAKRVSLRTRTTANQRNRRLHRSKTTITKMATSRRRSVTATATTISRCKSTLAKILALDQPDACEIEQMRAPASSRQPDPERRSNQQKYRSHRKRHAADPVQPHR